MVPLLKSSKGAVAHEASALIATARGEAVISARRRGDGRFPANCDRAFRTGTPIASERDTMAGLFEFRSMLGARKKEGGKKKEKDATQTRLPPDIFSPVKQTCHN